MSKTEQMLSSIEVAEMVEKDHSELLKDIRRYIKQLNEGKIPLVDFFQESTYVDTKGETRPCYDITKMGCEFIAHKLTGVKGAKFTATYIKRFHEMEDVIAENRIPSGEVPIRFYKNNKWYILTVGDEIYSLSPTEAKQISSAVAAMLKNNVPQVIEVVKSMIASFKRDCQLQVATECTVKMALPAKGGAVNTKQALQA